MQSLAAILDTLESFLASRPPAGPKYAATYAQAQRLIEAQSPATLAARRREHRDRMSDASYRMSITHAIHICIAKPTTNESVRTQGTARV